MGTPWSLRDLSVSLGRVAGIEEARVDFDAAHAKYVESLEIARGLAEELGTPESLRDLSRSLEMVAGIEHARGDLDAALVKYEESLRMLRGLVKASGIHEDTRWMNLALQMTACLEESRGDLASARAKFAESLEITRRLLAVMPSRETGHDYLSSVLIAASFLVDLARPSEALANLADALGAATDLESSCDDDLDMLDTCAAFHETYAKASAALSRADEAQRLFEHGAAIRARIAALKDRGER